MTCKYMRNKTQTNIGKVIYNILRGNGIGKNGAKIQKVWRGSIKYHNKRNVWVLILDGDWLSQFSFIRLLSLPQ
jgi:hypothetical protein